MAKDKKKLALAELPKWIKELSAVVAAVITIGGAAAAGGTWLVNKVTSDTNERLDKISASLDNLELDTTRTQLIMLINDYPDNTSEILKVANKYFVDLKGDWYVTEIFTKWAKDHDVDVSGIMSVHGATHENSSKE